MKLKTRTSSSTTTDVTHNETHQRVEENEFRTSTNDALSKWTRVKKSLAMEANRSASSSSHVYGGTERADLPNRQGRVNELIAALNDRILYITQLQYCYDHRSRQKKRVQGTEIAGIGEVLLKMTSA
jgi:hypothetical protein